jgi:hypothetical protein
LRFEYSGEMVELALRKIDKYHSILAFIRTDEFLARAFPAADDPKQQKRLAGEKRPGILPPGWHKFEISAIGRSFTMAMDGTVLCRDENLPVVARGDAVLWAWSGEKGRKHEFRNFAVAALDKETTAGTFPGIMIDKGPDFVLFKADGEDVPRRWAPPMLPAGGPDLIVLESINPSQHHNRMKLAWKLQPDGQPVVTGAQLEPSAPNGTLTGTITFQQNNCIEVQPGNGPPEQFIPRWKEHDGSIAQTIAKFKVGDKVKVTWIYEDCKRVTNVESAP